MKKILISCFVLIALISHIGIWVAAEDVESQQYDVEVLKAKVLRIKDTIEETFEESNVTIKTQVADVQILNKQYQGKVIEVVNHMSGNVVYDIDLKEGDTIVISKEIGPEGEEIYHVSGYERTSYVYQILGIFLVLLVVVGGWKGIKSIVSLAVTALLVLYVMIPMLLKGMNPILISIGVCAAATIVTMIIIAGWNKKSASAILGTVGGITAGGGLAYIYGLLSRLTGLNSEEAQMLMYIPQGVSFDFRGLLFAGILIGALGAAMDVSISIASSLTELSKKDETLSFKEIMKHGMNIGRDIMGTMSNTLILAYTGGALALILLFAAYERPIHEIINMDFVATEIIRSISGSIGLLFAIPVTALSYGLLAKR